MCGINGIINKSKEKKVDDRLIVKMNESLHHRGHDDSGIFIDKNIALGHTRLSIFDLTSQGHQPMNYEDIIITYNGEVFNFLEIKLELLREGYNFKSSSDTEVILKAYHCYGIEFVSRLNGMFAFSIYDKNKNRLFLVRDRFGIKPFYLYRDKEKFIFSSEIKAILQNSLNLTLNKEAIKEYLSLLYIPHPNTPYNEIEKLEAGFIYEINLENFEIKKQKYWEIEDKIDKKPQREIIYDIEQLLIDSIKKRMISDIEVGSFLSGGVDSSLISAIATNFNKNLKTFSIGYKGVNSFFDESEYALRVSKKYETKHIILNVDFNNTLQNLEKIIYYLDEPNGDTSVFLNYELSKLTKKYVSVGLSGLGGDELFGGYNRYQAFILASYLKNIPDFLKKSLLSITSFAKEGRVSRVSNKIRHLNKFLSSLDKNLQKTYINFINYHINTSIPNFQVKENILNSILQFDVEYYMSDNLLFFSDKMSMAHTLEMRVPFLDYRLVNYAFSIEQRHKTTIFNKKIILKKLALKYIDKDLVYRRKQGFAAPIEILLKQKGLEKTLQLLDNLLYNFIPKSYILERLDDFFKNNKDYSLQIYSWIVLSVWFKINRRYFE